MRCLLVVIIAILAVAPLLADSYDKLKAIAAEHCNASSYEPAGNDTLPMVLCKWDDGKKRYFVQSKGLASYVGYNGPSNVGLLLKPDATVDQVFIIFSPDTSSFVKRLRRSGYYEQFNGYQQNQKLTTVTGATFTSRAINQTVQAVLQKVQTVLPAPR